MQTATAIQLDFFQSPTETAHAHHATPHWTRTAHGKPVRAVYNPTVRCDWRCQTATGQVCECSCGGKYHGGRA